VIAHWERETCEAKLSRQRIASTDIAKAIASTAQKRDRILVMIDAIARWEDTHDHIHRHYKGDRTLGKIGESASTIQTRDRALVFID
jgi:hypothetical protein